MLCSKPITTKKKIKLINNTVRYMYMKSDSIIHSNVQLESRPTSWNKKQEEMTISVTGDEKYELSMNSLRVPKEY